MIFSLFLTGNGTSRVDRAWNKIGRRQLGPFLYHCATAMRIILVGINEQGEYVGARLPICLLLFTPVQGWQLTPAFQVCDDDLISLMISSEAISGGKRHFLSHLRDKMAEISRLISSDARSRNFHRGQALIQPTSNHSRDRYGSDLERTRIDFHWLRSWLNLF